MIKRGQAAMEYLLVASLILLIFVPTTFVFLNNMQKSSEELTMSKLNQLGNDIVNTAYTVYYQGVPAKVTFESNMPDKVLNISILKNWTRPANQLLIEFSFKEGEETLVFDSDVNINGTFPPESYSKGHKTIIITANESDDGTHYANIKII